jgi:hypothetical protein
MTDSHRKRRWAGAPINELRKDDQDPLRVPPHKKVREYRLTVRYTTKTVRTYTQCFPSKAGRDAFRKKVERDLRNKNISLWQYMGVAEDKEVSGPQFEESIDGIVTK